MEVKINLGPLHILTIVFVIMKLTKTITWGWLFVLLPSIISFSVWLFVNIMIIFFLKYMLNIAERALR